MKIFAIITLVGLLWWLGLWAPNAGAPGLLSGQGPRSHMLQVIIHRSNQDPAFHSQDLVKPK